MESSNKEGVMTAILEDRTGKYVARKPLTVANSGLVYIELRPDLDYTTIIGQGKPTLITQGIFRGFSLPIYAADNEELFATICVPDRWDGASDIVAHLYCWLAAAEDSKNFKLQWSWEHYTSGVDVIPATSTDVEVETATGAVAAQFQSYKVSFTMAYGSLASDDILGIRVRRIAASANECAGGIVINHYGVLFRRDKLGITTP